MPTAGARVQVEVLSLAAAASQMDRKDEPATVATATKSVACRVLWDPALRELYNSKSVTFHFLVSEGLTYTCATTPDVGLRLPFTFLDVTKQRFNVGSLRTRAWTAMEHELDRDFATVMADIMVKCNEGKMGDHISTLKGQVQEVKVVMTQNIEKIVERGERLDTLLDKTQELESSSTQFRASAKKVRAAMCMKNVRLWIIIGVLVIAVLVLIVLFATGVIKT